VHPESVPTEAIDEASYRVRFATSVEDLREALRLRYRVFNLELGEGLAESAATGEDRDEFDEVFHHILVEHRPTGRTIGTYRIQTSEMASELSGFYSDAEYEIEKMPDEIVRDAVEVGRACIEQEHRNREVLFLLWKGIAAYLLLNRKRYLFGCCSLTSQDERLAHAASRHLASKGVMHPTIRIPAREACRPADVTDLGDVEVQIPILFKTYLRHGAKVLSEPAIDRAFGTIDFLVMLDVRDMAKRSFMLYFGSRCDELP